LAWDDGEDEDGDGKEGDTMMMRRMGTKRWITKRISVDCLFDPRDKDDGDNDGNEDNFRI